MLFCEAGRIGFQSDPVGDTTWQTVKTRELIPDDGLIATLTPIGDVFELRLYLNGKVAELVRAEVDPNNTTVAVVKLRTLGDSETRIVVGGKRQAAWKPRRWRYGRNTPLDDAPNIFNIVALSTPAFGCRFDGCVFRRQHRPRCRPIYNPHRAKWEWSGHIRWCLRLTIEPPQRGSGDNLKAGLSFGMRTSPGGRLGFGVGKDGGLATAGYPFSDPIQGARKAASCCFGAMTKDSPAIRSTAVNKKEP